MATFLKVKKLMYTVENIPIAFIGVSHWHVPLYLRALKTQKLNIVAVCDRNRNIAEKIQRKIGDNCKVYTDTHELIESENPAFIFAFAPHNEMPSLAKEIIKRKIPFSIEKPLGITAKDVNEVKIAAEQASVFCSIPLVWRYSDLISGFKEKVNPNSIVHLAFKFIAGPPSRYLESSPWMLHSDKCGGGCMTNLGIHFIDMAMYLTESDSWKVLASSYHYTNEYDIETYATSLVKLSSGATFLLETGYAYPMDEEHRDNRWNIVTKNGYYTLGNNRFEERIFNYPTVSTPMSTDSDDYYAIYTIESIKQYLKGEKPKAGLNELLLAREMLDEMNYCAKE